MVVPGSIFSPYSRGTNNLLREGAAPVISAEDIIGELNITENKKEKRAKNPALNAELTVLLNHFDEPKDIDELAKITALAPADILSRISMLELQGVLKNIGGKWIKI